MIEIQASNWKYGRYNDKKQNEYMYYNSRLEIWIERKYRFQIFEDKINKENYRSFDEY